VIAVVPSRNSTFPATPVMLLSAAPTVAVKVSESPWWMLFEVAASTFAVPVCGTVTETADEVDEAYKLLVGVKTAVMLSLPCTR
jgi:hypothetical protein